MPERIKAVIKKVNIFGGFMNSLMLSPPFSEIYLRLELLFGQVRTYNMNE